MIYAMKSKRTGKTFNYTPATCPKHVMQTLGFTEEQTERMIRVRRILPFVESRTKPCIDARKLWDQIGRPKASSLIGSLGEHLEFFADSRKSPKCLSNRSRREEDHGLITSSAVIVQLT